MKNQDIKQNEREEEIRQFRLETLPIITWLQAIFYTLGTITIIRLWFNSNIWGTAKDGLIFGILMIIALVYIVIRVRKVNKNQVFILTTVSQLMVTIVLLLAKNCLFNTA